MRRMGSLDGLDNNRAGDNDSLDRRGCREQTLSDGGIDDLGDNISHDLSGMECMACVVDRGGGDQSSAEGCENGGGTHLELSLVFLIRTVRARFWECLLSSRK